MKTIIKSEILEKLGPKLVQVTKRIAQAIEDKQAILLRHHADSDGYCAALALERAILPLLYEKHTRERDTYHYYKRLPSKTPFYHYTDATRDITNFLYDVTRFEHKAPLIILVDHGSTTQSLASIKKVMMYGAEVMVIDHHPHTSDVSDIVSIHLNPHQIGSASDYSAGMLCSEIAYLLNPKLSESDYAFIAAVSGTSDKISSKELGEYAKFGHFPLQTVKAVGDALDFEAHYLGAMESRSIATDLLNYDSQKQKELLALLLPQVEERLKTVRSAVAHYCEVLEKGSYLIAKIAVDKIRNPHDFPPKGKVVGILLQTVTEKYRKPALCIGISHSGLNFRCSSEIKGFDVNGILNHLKDKLPHAEIDGGGHRLAGSLTFIEAAYDEVLLELEKYLKTMLKL